MTRPTDGWRDARVHLAAEETAAAECGGRDVRTHRGTPYPTLSPRPLDCGNLKCIQPHNPGTYSKSAPGQRWGGPRVLYQYSRVRGPNPDLTPAAGRFGGRLGAD